MCSGPSSLGYVGPWDILYFPLLGLRFKVVICRNILQRVVRAILAVDAFLTGLVRAVELLDETDKSRVKTM